MIAVPRPRAHRLRELVPGADRLGLEPAPRQLHQVERGEEVAVVPVGRVGDAGGGAAARGCGTARPGGTTCPVFGVPTWRRTCVLTSLLRQQLDRQVEDRAGRARAAEPGSSRVRVPHHRVTSAEQPLAQPEGGVLDPVRCSGGTDGQRAGDPLQPGAGAPGPSSVACCGRQHVQARVRRRPGGPARWRGPARRRTGASRRTPTRRGSAARSSTTPTRPVCGRARNRSTTPARSTRRGSRRRAAHRAPGTRASSGRPQRTPPPPRCARASWAGRRRATCTARPPPPGGRPSATSRRVYAAASHGSPASW